MPTGETPAQARAAVAAPRPIQDRLAGRMARLGTESAFEVLARGRALEAQGRQIIHLEIGEPDFATPQAVIDAGVAALQAGATHYTPSPGIIELRQAIAEEMSLSRGIEVDPGSVVVTPGGKPILFFTLLALVDAGDEVICPNPGFPIYESMIRYGGGTVVGVPLPEQLDFRLDIDALRAAISPRTKLIILNSPANPTGGILEQADLAAIAALAIEHDIMVLSDEIYSRMIYEGEHRSIAAIEGMGARAIILDGFSKTYAMTGWRLGYGVMPPDLAAQVSRLITNSVSCTATFTQLAGVEALTGDQAPVEAMMAEFRRRRAVIVEGLNQLPGVRCALPRGAFYAFPNITGTGLGSQELATLLLEEAGVAALSGTAFGSGGEGYLRFSYANSIENIREALDRIGGFLRARAG